MQRANDCYVYIYFRRNGTPCYVGKGRGDRWKTHLRKRTNPHLNRIIEAAKKVGEELPVVKLLSGLSDEVACGWEEFLIATIGRAQNGGPLVNFTDGGEGVKGLADESRARISAALKGKPLSEDCRKKLSQAAKNRSPEVAERIRLSREGKMRHTDATRAKMSKTRKGMIKSPEHCTAIGDAQRGIPKGRLTEAVKEKLSASLKGKPWTEARRKAGNKGYKGKPWSKVRWAAHKKRYGITE